LKQDSPVSKLRLILVQGKNSEQIVVKVNTTVTTLTAIADDILALGRLKISGVDWEIRKVKVNISTERQRNIIVQPESEPE
jgi:hypothetical protein